MELEHTLRYDCLKTAEVKLMFFQECINCTKNKKFAKDREWMGIFGPVTSDILPREVVVNDPLVSCEGYDPGGL